MNLIRMESLISVYKLAAGTKPINILVSAYPESFAVLFTLFGRLPRR